MSKILIDKLEEIENLYNSYLAKTKDLTEQEFNYKINASTWSIAQVLHHIWFALDGTYLYVNKQLQKNIDFKDAGIVHFFRSIGLNMVLHSPLKLKAPKYISENVIKNITHAEISQLSEASFNNFRQLLETFPKELEQKEIFKHPVVGWVNIYQTLGFLKGHTVHHKMQIENLLNQIK
jgi:uncharacterized damage-inducible protein DinB